jgi:hypothetical protein
MFTMESSWYNREIYWEYSGISIKLGMIYYCFANFSNDTDSI